MAIAPPLMRILPALSRLMADRVGLGVADHGENAGVEEGGDGRDDAVAQRFEGGLEAALFTEIAISQHEVAPER